MMAALPIAYVNPETSSDTTADIVGLRASRPPDCSRICVMICGVIANAMNRMY